MARNKLNDEDMRYIQKHYGRRETKSISNILNVTESTILYHARKLGLTAKEPKIMSAPLPVKLERQDFEPGGLYIITQPTDKAKAAQSVRMVSKKYTYLYDTNHLHFFRDMTCNALESFQKKRIGIDIEVKAVD